MLEVEEARNQRRPQQHLEYQNEKYKGIHLFN
jgi:hypothetical protein